jgi:hypothetical protein
MVGGVRGVELPLFTPAILSRYSLPLFTPAIHSYYSLPLFKWVWGCRNFLLGF